MVGLGKRTKNILSPMNGLKAILEWWVWFHYKSPVRISGVIGSRISDWGIRAIARNDPLLWGYYAKCILLAVVVEVIHGLNSFVNPS
jgi:hypothetical protein